ncbi:esterase/lipase/thioesterase family protein, partial [Sesbania bispinosa]
GEEYKLFWPEQSEFVRMAARFGAKIVPFGAVGEDDVGQVVIDYDDLVKIPFFRSEIENLTKEAMQLRTDAGGEVANQQVHLPGILPKVPGRFYYYFGKPFETEASMVRPRHSADQGGGHIGISDVCDGLVNGERGWASRDSQRRMAKEDEVVHDGGGHGVPGESWGVTMSMARRIRQKYVFATMASLDDDSLGDSVVAMAGATIEEDERWQFDGDRCWACGF